MGSRLSPDQVAGLAPDAASVAAGRKLAAPSVWSETGGDEAAVWGLAKGSGKNPYQVAVDLSGPAYRCSCPSRKIPCKHVLGLLFLAAGDQLAHSTTQPEHVREWLAGRAEREQAAVSRARQRETKEADPAAQAARIARRAETIAQGLEDLERFLTDLVREGLAAARERPAGWWDTQARRLIDAQAPALAERVRALGASMHAGRPDWPSRALEQTGMLYLIVRAWRRGEALPGDLRDDLRAHVGWARNAREVREAALVEPGPWAVIGVRVQSDERLRTRRTWLERPADGRVGLILDFALPGAAFDGAHPVGTVLDGEMCRFPGRSGLRVIPAGETPAAGDWPGPRPQATVAEALAKWSTALARDPFTGRLAVTVGEVVPVRAHDRWWLRDAHGNGLPIAGAPWPLVALAGGRPVGVAGEWDGGALTPLCAHVDGVVWSLSA